MVEVRGWLNPRHDTWAESCLFHALRRVLGCEEAHARGLAREFREQGGLTVDAQLRETAERLSDALQGVGALIYLTPGEGQLTFSEVHPVTWGERPEDTASCQRLSASKFQVDVWLPSIDELTGEPIPRPTPADRFWLANVPARRVEIIGEHEDAARLNVELVQPVDSVAFIPDPTLSGPGDISFETAMRLAGGRIIANRISEDREFWYFYFFCFGPNCQRISKAGGSSTRIGRAPPT